MKKNNKKQINLKRFKLIIEILTCFIFFAVLLVFMFATIFSTKESFSELENKSLASLPRFSFQSLFSGDYIDGIETYASDHFAGRSSWIKLKSDTELLSGNIEQKGIYILEDRLIEKVAEPEKKIYEANLAGIKKFSESTEIPIYMMIVPSSAEFYKNEIPSYYPNLDQKKFIEQIYSNVPDEINTIDIYKILSDKRDEYIYYRTDHHWTSKGAYYAYKFAGNSLMYSPFDESKFDIEYAGHDFQGTFYSKVLNDNITKDFLSIYHYNESDANITAHITDEFGKPPKAYSDIYFREYLDVKDKYATYTGPNTPLVTLKNDTGNGKILIIKDSYAHCFAPFLSEHYEETTMLDLRYIQTPLKNVVDISEYDQILFLYNASTFSTDANLRKLSYYS